MVCVLLTAFNADAGRITMSNPKQSTTENGHTVRLLQQHLQLYLCHQIEALSFFEKF
ncbi:hypothetical protein ABIC80_002929 [Kosakonia sp. 1610]